MVFCSYGRGALGKTLNDLLGFIVSRCARGLVRWGGVCEEGGGVGGGGGGGGGGEKRVAVCDLEAPGGLTKRNAYAFNTPLWGLGPGQAREGARAGRGGVRIRAGR